MTGESRDTSSSALAGRRSGFLSRDWSTSAARSGGTLSGNGARTSVKWAAMICWAPVRARTGACRSATHTRRRPGQRPRDVAKMLKDSPLAGPEGPALDRPNLARSDSPFTNGMV